MTIEKRTAGIPVTLTGRIEAEDEVALGFRISGRIIRSDLNVGNVGDRIAAGQLVAQLESQNERNALRAAQANLAAAEGQLVEARNHFERQDTLLKQGWTTRANHDQAPDVSKIEILGAQDERIFVEFSMQELASLGVDRSALLAALPGCHPLLFAAQRATAERLLQPGGDRRQSGAGARVAAREHRQAPGRRIPERGRARLSAASA